MIQFRCYRCQNTIEASPDAAGKKMYCQRCYFELTVPETSTVGTVPAEIYAADDEPLDVRELSSRILPTLPCSVCHTKIAVRQEQIGTTVVCPDCGTAIKISGSLVVRDRTKPITPSTKLDNFQKPALTLKQAQQKKTQDNEPLYTVRSLEKNPEDHLIGFHCRLCGTLMHEPETETGKTVTCPDCGTENTVPKQTLQVKQESPPIAEPIVNDADTAADKPLVPVVCRVCRTRMYAAETDIGKFMECPDCAAKTEIKFVPKQERILPVFKGEYGVAAADISKPQLRTNVDYRYEQGSVDQSVNPSKYSKNRQETAAPQYVRDYREVSSLPAMPFLGRIVKQLLHYELLIQILITSVLLGSAEIFLLLLLFITGICDFGTIFFSYTVGFAAALLGMVMHVGNIQTVFAWSAIGVNRPQHGSSASFTLFDAGIMALWLFFLVILSATPGFAVAKLFDGTTSAAAITTAAAAAWGSAFVVFPILYLSCAETGSMFNVFGINTFRSLIRYPSAWLRFYFCAAAAMAISFVPLLSGKADEGTLIYTGFAFTFFTTAYWFLLGCLAFVLSSQSVNRTPSV